MRVLLADTHPSVRSALRLLLEEAHNIKIVGEVSNVKELLVEVPQLRPDLILLEWDMAQRRAKRIMPSLNSNGKRPVVIALSSHPEERKEALSSGADMFVYEGDPPEILLSVVKDAVDWFQKGGENEKLSNASA